MGFNDMLKGIVIVTLSVLNLGPVEDAYRDGLDYRTVDRGVISEELGTVWNTPDASGHEFVLMQPASEAAVYLRFVETPEVPGYAPLNSFGWNATELLVTDPDELAARLEDSAFEIIGPPKDLWDAPNAPRAMQTLGPGNEILYLTRNGNFATDTFVDRVFIMVVGGPSMTEFRDYYESKFGLTVGDATPFSISVISRAQNLPPETTYPLAVGQVSADFLIEFDEYPTTVGARPVSSGDLPPGTAMVSFYVDRIDAIDVPWNATPKPISDFPYNGRRAGVTIGPAGEWIELIEHEATQDGAPSAE
jgi:catechol 2,3-dioxygenase-like lactoylglutathione lyase family enzyme